MINKKFKNINDYIININNQVLETKDFYYYIANNTLTRNPFASKILHFLDSYKKVPSISYVQIIKKIFMYYVKVLIILYIYICRFIIYKIVKKKNSFENTEILIDTYFILEKISTNKAFSDTYFLGLENVLKEKKIKYSYLVKNFYGPIIDFRKFYNTLKVLNKCEHNVVSEYDILNLKDIIKIFRFILIYPFKILPLLQKAVTKEDKIFNYSLINSINAEDMYAYIRYLTGRKLNKISNKFKIISWCEYQNIDKSLYKGIHDSKVNAKIYGSQFLVSYDSWLNFNIPKEEERFGLTPDIVLTNGRYYLQDIEVEKKEGVSLRYKYIFDSNEKDDEGEYILVLGSFIVEQTIDLIQLVKNSDLSGKIRFRIHPTHSFKMYEAYIPKDWTISDNETLDEAVSLSFLVITNGGTGTSLESVCNKKSTILIGNRHTFDSIPMIDMGKGEIWDIALNEDQIKKVYNNLLEFRKNHYEKIIKLASWYKENFFIEPTEENIIKAFDLNGEKEDK